MLGLVSGLRPWDIPVALQFRFLILHSSLTSKKHVRAGQGGLQGQCGGSHGSTEAPPLLSSFSASSRRDRQSTVTACAMGTPMLVAEAYC